MKQKRWIREKKEKKDKDTKGSEKIKWEKSEERRG